ncbi:hypothetical protein HID58_056119 [Brassica napus]|uniref:Uncharacterized protein n=1 Tax=Brassica napus TaxID=3708 RepID=A0ABQ8AMG8_BRANA|nr:hypothetical protein HID58_056119 [Brassica napus]
MVSEKSVNNYKTAPHNVDPNSYDDDQGADPNSYFRNLSLSYFAAEPLRMLRDHHKIVIFVVVLDVMQVEATMYFPVAVDELSMSSGSAIAGATKRSVAPIFFAAVQEGAATAKLPRQTSSCFGRELI